MGDSITRDVKQKMGSKKELLEIENNALKLYIKQLIIAISGYCGIQYSQAVPTTSPDSFQTEPGTVSENVSYSVHDLKVDFQLAVYKKV